MSRSMSTSSDDSSIVFEMHSRAGSRATSAATSRAVSRSPSVARPPLLPLSSTAQKAAAQSTPPLTNTAASSTTNTQEKVTDGTQKDATLPNAVAGGPATGKAVVTSVNATPTVLETSSSDKLTTTTSVTTTSNTTTTSITAKSVGTPLATPVASVVPAAGVTSPHPTRSLSSVSSDSSSPSFHFSPSPRHELDADELNKEVSDIKAENGELRVNKQSQPENQQQYKTIDSSQFENHKDCNTSSEDSSLNLITSAPAAPPAALISDGLNSSMSNDSRKNGGGGRGDHDGEGVRDISSVVSDDERETSEKVINELNTVSKATLEDVLLDPTLNQRLLPNQRKALALAHARRILRAKMEKFRKSVAGGGKFATSHDNDDDDNDDHASGGNVGGSTIGIGYMGAVLSSMKWEDGVLGEEGSPSYSNFDRVQKNSGALECNENASEGQSELKDAPPRLLGARRVDSIHSDSDDAFPQRGPIFSQTTVSAVHPSNLGPSESQNLNPKLALGGRTKSFPKTRRLIPYEEPSRPSEHFSYARALSAERRQRNTEMTHEEAYGSELIPTHHKLVFEEDDSHLPTHPAAVTKQREIRIFEEIFSSNLDGSEKDKSKEADLNSISAEGKEGSPEDEISTGSKGVLIDAGKIEKIRTLFEHDLNPTDEVLFLPEENLIIQPRMKFTGFKAIGDLYEDSYLPKWRAARENELQERAERRNKMGSEARTAARAALIARLSKPLAKDRIVFEERAPSSSSSVSDGDEHIDGESEKRDTGLNDDLVASSPRLPRERKTKSAPKPPQRIVGDDGAIRIILSHEDMAKRYPEKGAGANAKSKGVGGNVPSGCQLPFFDSHAYYLRISVPAGIFNLKQALHLRGAKTKESRAAHAKDTNGFPSASQKKAYSHAPPRRREVRFAADSVLKEASGFFEHETRAETITTVSGDTKNLCAGEGDAASFDRDETTPTNATNLEGKEGGSQDVFEDKANLVDKEDGDGSSSFILVAIDRYTPLLSIIERFGPAYFPLGGQLALAKTGELLAGSSFPAPLGLVTPSDVSTGYSTHKAADQPSSPFGSSSSPQTASSNTSWGGGAGKQAAAAAGMGLSDVLSYKCGTGTTITVGMLESDPRLNDLCYVTSVELDEVMERKRIMTGRLVERNMLIAGLAALLEHELRDEYKKMRRGLPTFLDADGVIEQAAGDRVKAIETLIQKERKASAKEKRQKKDLYRDVRLTKYDFRKARRRRGSCSSSESSSSRASSSSSSSSFSSECAEELHQESQDSPEALLGANESEKRTKPVSHQRNLSAYINGKNTSADCGPLLELQSLLASMKHAALSLDNCLPFTDGSAAAKNPFAGTKSDSCAKGYEKTVRPKKSRRSDKRRGKTRAGGGDLGVDSETSLPQKDEAQYNHDVRTPRNALTRSGEVDREDESRNPSSAYLSQIQDDPLRYVAFFGGDASYYALGSEPSKTEALRRLEALQDQERARRAAKKELKKALREGERRPQSPRHSYRVGIEHVDDRDDAHRHDDDDAFCGPNDQKYPRQNGANNSLERAIERILHPEKEGT